MKIRFPKPIPLSAIAQAVGLRQLAPFGMTTVSRHTVNWQGAICPSEFARSYAVELDYRMGSGPEVWVREPDLKKLSNGRPLPHVYDQDTQRLCLYVPGCGFWRPWKALARTIIPWSALWLFNFEIWLVTDVWHTAGIHPDFNLRRFGGALKPTLAF